MIFWILLAIAVAFPLFFLYVDVIEPTIDHRKAKKSGHYSFYSYADWGTVGFSSFFAVVGFGLAVVILLPFSYMFQTGGVLTEEKKVNLQALASKEQIEGRIAGGIFITSGYVQSEPVLSYISEDDGAYRSEWADANKSVVYQDEETEPYVWEREYAFYSAWLVPWSIASEPRYEFHVPEGSISGDISVTP